MNHRTSQWTATSLFGLGVALALSTGCSDKEAQWTTAGSLLDARSYPSATLLADDSVLFAGGENGNALVARVERRATTTGQWSIGAKMIEPRAYHAALRLGDGRVVFMGGRGASGPLTSVEVYDPKTDAFLPRSPMPEPRDGSTATLLEGKAETIMVTGGSGPMGRPTKTVMLYDVAKDTWSMPPDAMSTARLAHTATLLDAGVLLILGGTDGTAPQASAERYGAATKRWSRAGNLKKARSKHTATLLDAETILVVGGTGASGVLESAEKYDIKSGQSTEVFPSPEARSGHTATRLDDETVLIVGGTDAEGHPKASVERYDPVANAFKEAPAMSAARVGHTATWLADGSVLVAGGGLATSAERFVPEVPGFACEHTTDCPHARICKAKRCEQPVLVGPLSAQNACSQAGGHAGTGSGLPLAMAAAMLMVLRWRRGRRSTRRSFSLSLSLSLSLLALLVVPRPAEAQTSTFSLDRLPLAGGPEDGMALVRPVFGKTQLFGQVAFGVAQNPLRVQAFVADPNKARALLGPAVAHQMTGYFTVGAELLERGAIQVTLPYIPYQRGYPTDNRAAGLDEAVALAPSALGDMRIDARVLVAWTQSKTFSLAARGALFLPTGDSTSFTGERSAWGQAGIAAEFDAKAFFVTANLGITVRPKSSLVNLTVGTELAYAVGAYLPLVHDRVRLGAEVFGTAGLLPEPSGGISGFPVEASLSTRVALGARRLFFLGFGGGGRIGAGVAPDGRFLVRIGGVLPLERAPIAPRVDLRTPEVMTVDSDRDGFVDVDDTCPLAREDDKRAKDGCPETDEDRDGIDTSVDACPKVAEDRDGIDDEDGCPEDDADADGFADIMDQCPKEPGVHAEDPAKEGCPQFIRRVEMDVVLYKQIDFDFDSVTVSPASYPILDELVRFLAANPAVKRLRIEGHTDNMGGAEYNAALSLRRATAVRDVLVGRGKIDPARLLSVGLGQSKPIASNDTASGRAKNRRVELHIEQDAGVNTPIGAHAP
jgi:OmpA-OmpF porin, OOP family